MKKPVLITSFIIGSLFLLAGCEGQNARDILGLDRKTPDEFRVVSRPPLSTPPDFQLRPPVEGDGKLNLPPSDLQAKSLVLDGKDISDVEYDVRRKMGAAETAVGVVDAYEDRSDADKALLSRAGVGNSDSQIRQRIYEERIVEKKQAEANWLFPRKDGGDIVDAEKEKQRLEANKAQGKAITEGETPTVDSKERGILEDIF